MAGLFRKSRWRVPPPHGALIDWSHPLASGLLVFVDGGLDRISNNALMFYTSAGMNDDGTFYTGGGSYDCAYITMPPSVLDKITTEINFVSFSRILSYSPSYATFCSIPYSTSNWNWPYGCSLCRNAASTGLQIGSATASSSYQSFTLSSGALEINTEINLYSGGFSPSTARFYSRLGGLYDKIISAQPLSFGAGATLCFGNHNINWLGEPLNAIFGPQLLYNRLLSYDELKELENNPYQIFKKNRLFFAITSLTSYALNSRWDVRTTDATASQWNVLAKSTKESSWNIYTARQQGAYWNNLVQKTKATGWDIKVQNSTGSAWNITLKTEHQANWNIGTRSSHTSRWNIHLLNTRGSVWNIRIKKEKQSLWNVGIVRVSTPIAVRMVVVAEDNRTIRIATESRIVRIVAESRTVVIDN